MKCVLCHKVGAEIFHSDPARDFYRCPHCTIIFVPRTSLLSSDEEKKRYDLHNNTETDPAYREYFLKTAIPVMAETSKESFGLDFGCGATQLLGKIFQENGRQMDAYDPFYFPDESIWQKNFDFAVMNEVIEHLSHPAEILARLRFIISGPLFVRTKPPPDNAGDFSNWYYKRDPTHIQFFTTEAMEFIGTTRHLVGDLYRIDWK